MGLRFKILAPGFIGLFTLALIIHFYMVPKFIEIEKLNSVKHNTSTLEALLPSILQSYLVRDLSALYENLDLILKITLIGSA